MNKKIKIELDKKQIDFIKYFLPIDSPYCSSCMYYTEEKCSKCLSCDRCFLDEIIEKLKVSNNE